MYILEHIEHAVLSVVSGSMGTTVDNYYTSNNSEAVKTSSAVIVQAGNMSEDFLGSGVWHVDTRIYLMMPYEGTGSVATRNAAAEQLAVTLFTSSFAPAVETASAGSLGIYDIYSTGHNISVQENHWVIEHALEVVAVNVA